MTTLTSTQPETSNVKLPNLETEGIVFSRRTNMHGLSRVLAACLIMSFPTIAISQNYTKEHYTPRVIFYASDAVVGQLVDGAGWKTTINLVNLDTQQASF